jgi:hypothetical protein
MEAMLQKIRQQQPTRPRTKIRSLGDSSSELAVKPARNRNRCRGICAVSWITLKALEKERARRYGSPSELAADIQRYLQDQPVLAGPPSATYRASKFIRRHRFGVGVGVAAAVLLVALHGHHGCAGPPHYGDTSRTDPTSPHSSGCIPGL